MTLYLHMQHDEGRLGCAPSMHCVWHHVDELGGYIRCPECGHAYRTAWALKRAYLREHLRLWRNDMRRPLVPPEGAPDADWGDLHVPRLLSCWILLRSLFVRPSRITFCQECVHDF